MNHCAKTLLLLIFCAFSFNAISQTDPAVDSLKLAINQSKTTEEKVYWMDKLSRTLMNVNLKEADEYGKQLIALAEESRNRKLMFDAYMSNGIRCSYFASTQDFMKRAIGYYGRALDIARNNKMDGSKGSALLRLSAIHLIIPDNNKALSYANEAASIISNLKNDSLRAESSNTFGNVYLARNDKTLALGHYLNGLRIAEGITKPTNHALLRTCYLHLSNFYSGIGDYDKAIDYSMEANRKLEQINEKYVPYQRAIDLNNIGKLYSAKGNDEIAITYYKRSLATADSMKFSTLKVPAYASILEQYMKMDQPQQALDYLQSSEGLDLQKFLNEFGFSGNIDMTFGGIYTRLNQFDSAKYYFARAEAYYEKASNPIVKMYFYFQRSAYYKKIKDNPKAIEGYLKVKEIAEKTGQIEMVERVAKQLDTLYQRQGDYIQANFYNSVYYKYKDSLQALNKEKELAQLEAADEQQRQEKILLEKEEQTRQKNNIQYLAITIGIAALFLALVVLGMFKVSATTIKMLGFFAFIMFFEFIFLIFKKKINSITKGEPWMDLLFMIGLAAVLLPLHHWLEKKVIHYLTSHNRLTSAANNLRSRLFRRTKTGGD